MGYADFIAQNRVGAPAAGAADEPTPAPAAAPAPAVRPSAGGPQWDAVNAASAASAASPERLRILRAEAANPDYDAATRAGIEREIARITAGGPSLGDAQPAPRTPAARYVPADDEPVPADRPSKPRLTYADFIAQNKAQPAPPPPPGLWDQAKATLAGMADARDPNQRYATERRGGNLREARPSLYVPADDGMRPGEAGQGRGMVNPPNAIQPAPIVNDYQSAGPSGALADIRANTAARDARLGAMPTGYQSVLERGPVPEPGPTYGPAEMQENRSPAAIERARQLGEYVAPTNPAQAKPFSPAQNIAQNISEATTNPVARGAAAGFAGLADTGIGAVRLAADLVGATDVAAFARGAAQDSKQVAGMTTAGLQGNDKLVADVTASIMNSAPALAMGVAGGAPLSTLFVQSTLAEYNNGRDAGFGVGDSLARAGTMGFAEALGERFGLGEQITLLKSVTRQLPRGEVAKVFGSLLAKEIPGEQLTTAMQFLADKIGPAALHPNATIEDYLNAAGDTLKVTIGQTAVMGGGPAAIQTGREQMQRADAAVARSAMTVPERAAADAGLIRPTEQRKQAEQRLDDFAAQHVVRPDLIAKIKERAAEVPLPNLTGFYRRAIDALQRRGLFGNRQFGEAELGALEAPQGVTNEDPTAGRGAEAAPALSSAQDVQNVPNARNVPPARPPAQQGIVAPAADVESQGVPAGREDLNAPIAASELLGTPLDEAAHQAATSPLNDRPEPTDAQKAAGNYKLGHVRIDGMDISIENPQGSVRRSKADDPNPWEVVMPAHYGYVKGTEGSDGDHVDIFIGPQQGNGRYWVINQTQPDAGTHDEHKVVTGVGSAEEAVDLYKRSFADGFGDKVFGSVSAEFNADQIKARLPSMRKPKPVQRPARPVQSAGAPAQPVAMGDGAGVGTPVAPAPAARVIARAGRTPTATEPIELRTNADGTLTPHMGGKAMVGYDSGEPIVLPAGVSDMDAKKAIRAAGAVSNRVNFYPVKGTADAATVDNSKQRNEGASDGQGQEGRRQEVLTPAAGAEGKGSAAAPAPKPDQRAARAKARMALDPEHDSMLQALAKLGGIQREVMAREFGLKPEELKHTVVTGGIKGFPFRKTGGRGLDSAITALREAGYFMGVADEDVRNAFEEAVYKELGGGRELTPQGTIRAALDAQANDLFDVAALDDFTADDLEDAGYADASPEVKAATQALLAAAEDLGVDTEALREDAARLTEGKAQDAYHAEVQRLAQEAIAAARGAAEGADAAAARGGRDDREQADGAQGREEGGAEGLTLEAQTASDLKAKTDRESQADALDERAQIDAEREGFSLQQQAAPETRKDTTTDLFGGPSVEDVQRAAQKKGKAPSGPDLFSTAEENNAPAPVQATQAQPDGLVTIPADEGAFASALDGMDPGALTQADGEQERLHALFGEQPDRVSLPRAVGNKVPAGVDLMTPDEAKAKLAEWKAEAERQGEKLAGPNGNRVVISLFDASGVLAQPWHEAGYRVFTYDLQTGADINEFNAENLLEQHGNDEVFAILAQPPCTDFASSGAQWWKAKDEDGRTEASNELVRQVLRTIELFRPPVWVMENPVGRIARLNKLPEPTLQFDPWHFGDPYTKRTLLWGRFDPHLPMAPVEPEDGSKMHRMSSSAKYERSLTSEPFAYALFMANNADAMGPAGRLAAEFAGVTRYQFDAALRAGHSEAEIKSAIEDSYYENDLETVRDTLDELTDDGPADRDWAKATPDELEAEIGRLSDESRRLHRLQLTQDGAEREETIRAMDAADREVMRLTQLLPDEEQQAEEEAADEEFEPPTNWTTSMFGARTYAKHLGIEVDGKELPELVKAIQKATGVKPPKAKKVEAPAPAADPIDERIAKAEADGVTLSDADKADIRRELELAAQHRAKADRTSAAGADPLNKGNAFPMGVGFTTETKRSNQRIDASVKRAGEAVELWKRAETLEKNAERLLSGKGTEADKAKAADKKAEAQRLLVGKLVNWQKGDKIGDFTIERVNKDADGYPATYTISGDGIVKGVTDKVDVAREFFGRDKAKFRALVDEVRAAAPSPAPAPAPAGSTFEAFKAAMRAVYDGTASVDDFRAAYKRVRDAAAVKAELGKLTKDDLISTFGIMARPSEKKDSLVDTAYGAMVRGFALGKDYGPRSYFMTRGGLENYEKQRAEALDALVEATTAADLAAYAAQVKQERETRAAERAAKVEALQNPKTLQEFQQFIIHHTREGKSVREARLLLTPEQRVAFDDLAATTARAGRKERKDESRDVRVAGQVVDGQIIATKHTKKGHDLFVVQLAERVSREDYETLNESAKKIGGYYSSYRGGGAVPGFQFTTRDQADAFVKLAQGDKAAASEAAAARRDAFEDDRSQTAVQRLTEMADRLEERADESLSRDRKTNTDRRARMASSAEASARADKAMAITMRNIASAIDAGKARFLDRVRQKVQVELLQSMVRNARDTELRAKYPAYIDQERHKEAPPTAETAEFAEWPTYTAYRSDLASLGRQLVEVDGTKLLGQKLLKVADDVTEAFTAFAKEPANFFKLNAFSTRGTGERAAFATQDQAQRAIERSGYKGKAIPWSVKRGEWMVIMSPSEAMARGIWKGDGDKRITLSPDFGAELVEKMGRAARRGAKVNVPWQFETAHSRRAAFARMGIETPYEFRAALREFIGLREQPAEADKVKQLERSMIGRRNDGLDFFPTPEETADEMVAAAGIEPGQRVLEPSAGWGHIAERIREAGVEPDVVEVSNDRRELLEAKGFNVVGRDFMDLKDGGYDRILMNPPFSDGRDIEHVRHAYSLLKPGGRLVAIMGEGAFTQSFKRAEEFRQWLDEVGGSEEKLAEGTFLDPSLPVNTSVNARMVVIDKADGADIKFSLADEFTPPFYSELARQVERVGMNAGPAASWKAWLKGLPQKGVKPDEIEWTGIAEWLDLQQGKVTKAAVFEFLKGNGVKVSETVLGEPASAAEALTKRLAPFGITVETDPYDDGLIYVDEDGDAIDYDELPRAARDIVDQVSRGDAGNITGATKYGTYTLPGGKNYREVLLTLPSMTGKQAVGRRAVFDKYLPEIERIQAEQDAMLRGKPSQFDNARFRALGDELDRVIEKRDREAAALAGEAPDYTSPHWDEKNILAHIRLNDRTDADGKRVLFVEEIQSDWAQEGKKQGFVGDMIPQTTTWEAVDTLDEFDTREQAQAWADANPPPNPGENMEARLVVRERERFGTGAGQPSRWTVIEEQRSTVAQAPSKGGLPRAPFIGKTDAWVALAIKRVVKMAVDEGYDRVAFVTGEQSAERYDLSKHVDHILYRKNEDGTLDVFVNPLKGEQLAFQDQTAEDVERHIGKAIVDRMLSGEGRTDQDGLRRIEGDGLKVGGEGMRAFYDKIVPSVAKDVLKKLGGGTLTTSRIDVQGKPENGRALVQRQAYEGPEYTSAQLVHSSMRARINEAPGSAASMEQQLRDVANAMRGGDTFAAAMAWHGSPALAHALGGKLVPLPEVIVEQPAFDITPAMREKAAGGVPMFALADGRGVDGRPAAPDTAAREPVTDADRTAVKLLGSALRPYRPGLLLDAVPARQGTARDNERVAAAELTRAIFGRRAIFFRSNQPFVNGLNYDALPGRTFLWENAERPHMAVLGHELTHAMADAQPDLYAQLRDRVLTVSRDLDQRNLLLTLKREKAKLPAQTAEQLTEEFIADVVGDNFMDPEFWRLMAKDQPGGFRKVVDAVLKWLDDVIQRTLDYRPFGTDVYLTDVRAARAAVADAMRQFSGREVGATPVGMPDMLASTRREFLVGMASAATLASTGAQAATTLGRAKAIDPAVMGQTVTPTAAKLLRGNGATNIEGTKAIGAALRDIEANGPQEVRALAAEIRKLLPAEQVLLTVHDEGQWNVHGAVELAPLVHLRLMASAGHTGLTYGTFLHETLHLAVAARYRSLSSGLRRDNDTVLGRAAPAAARELEQFHQVWREFKAAAQLDGTSGDLARSIDQARSDPDEFFVRALTDPLLQQWMAGKRYDGKTLWERFKDWVKSSLFGFKKDGTEASWLDAALAASNDLKTAMLRDAADFGTLRAANRLSRAKSTAREAKFSVATDPAPTTPKPSTGILDTILRKAGGDLVARLTSPGYDKLLDLLDRAGTAVVGQPYLYAKAGLVADYGLTPDYKRARADMQTGIRKGTREAATVIEQLQTLDRAQARIAYLWMQEKPDTALERELMAALPDDSRAVLRDLKERVDELGREAVELGLLSQETYERNAMAYLHRSYQKYEQTDDAAKVARGRAVRILGDQFKGRGMRDDVGMQSIASPDWWQRAERAGGVDTSLKGQKFNRLELRTQPDEATPGLFGDGGPQRLGKLQKVVYWPAGEPVPAQFADWRNDGTWEARFFDKAGKVGMWRDFTLAERTAMGEIQEVRYSAAKTLLQATRDVETARLLDWVARKVSVLTEGQVPEGSKVVKAVESLTRPYLETEWVQVPDAQIPGTAGVKKYGNLAGRFVPGPVWNDLRQVVSLSDQGDLAELYQTLLNAWKVSKTALSPATHMNNVMSNFILADAHDIQARHMATALNAWVRHRDRGSLKADPVAKKLIEDYQDNGGDGGKFNEGELREDVAKDLLEQLERDVNELPTATAGVSAAHVLSLLQAREFRQAFAAIGETKTAGMAAAPAKALIKLYGREDEVFRLAAFIKARADGLSDHDAGQFARASFLDYSINAPWIQALRKTAFPFIAFTYRAVPMLLRIAADKPHKLAKYALVAGALNALAYGMLGGGGDEDKERALLPDEKAGKVWGIFPKLLRMPWNDAHGSPVFLDVRRWVPAGDVIDTNANHAAVPVPAPLVPGGPLVLLAELMLNRSSFTGQAITKETDTLAEKYAKMADYLWKGIAPNFPGLPGAYSTESLVNAGKGKTDVFGREQSLGQAALSSIGVKVASYPADTLERNASIEARSQIFEIRRGLRADARQLARQGITQEEYDERVKAATEKIQRIAAELDRKVKGARGEPVAAP